MKRYSMQVWRDGDLEHVEDPRGEWVRWEDVEELQVALDRLHGRRFSERVYEAMLADNTSLRKKVEELLKDKERLDWLDRKGPEVVDYGEGDYAWCVGSCHSDHLRDAIDLEMEETEP